MDVKEFVLGKRRPCSFTTRLREEECINRLAKSLTKKNSFKHSDYTGKISRKIRGKTFMLWLPVCNSWRQTYYGKLGQSDDQTLIDGYFDISRFAKVFSMFWLSSAFIFLLLGVVVLTTNQEQLGANLGIALIPLIMMIAGALICRFGIWNGESDRRHLIAFIQDALEAAPTVAIVAENG